MKRYYILGSLLILLLTGCQSESFTLSEDITRIEVVKLGEVSPSPEAYENGEGEVVKVITDQKEIDKVMKNIEGAKVSSLENADIDLPMFKVRFIQDDNIILTLGYYPADQEREKSSLIDLKKEQRYTTKSPLDLIEQSNE